MSFKQLFVFVEGNDDERFFEFIIKPKLSNRYDLVQIIKYSEEKKEKIDNYISSIKQMKADYIFTNDIDNVCSIKNKKNEIKTKWKNIDEEKIFIVIKEIESWYLAGLSDEKCKLLKIRIVKNTDEITKEEFNNIISNKFESRIAFMVEILKNFSIEIAIQKNKSFKYFIEQMNIIVD
ncbi:hypothetical protein XO10_05830 [Marinitoga sp. 1135]|uniref:hypothetical protein n=1 Tax=Marinitoga sp. 1135 TaxID=1643333 RepID=UPI00158612BB|nr:hypothetical protein [Marinitoga sp. 1135]NUU95801.1 hypothetical protein [Marinitoga sp. 1135]